MINHVNFVSISIAILFYSFILDYLYYFVYINTNTFKTKNKPIQMTNPQAPRSDIRSSDRAETPPPAYSAIDLHSQTDGHTFSSLPILDNSSTSPSNIISGVNGTTTTVHCNTLDHVFVSSLVLSGSYLASINFIILCLNFLFCQFKLALALQSVNCCFIFVWICLILIEKYDKHSDVTGKLVNLNKIFVMVFTCGITVLMFCLSNKVYQYVDLE